MPKRLFIDLIEGEVNFIHEYRKDCSSLGLERPAKVETDTFQLRKNRQSDRKWYNMRWRTPSVKVWFTSFYERSSLSTILLFSELTLTVKIYQYGLYLILEIPYIMNTKITPEVASAHRNLEELCEKFEASIAKLSASPQSLRPHEFYQCECVPIAAVCVEALSTLQSAQSYEVTACENAIAEADNTLRQQKRKLEESMAQIKVTYENAVTKSQNELRQQKHRFEEGAVQRERTYKDAVAEADETFNQRKRDLEQNANQKIKDIEYDLRQVRVNFTFSQEKVTVPNPSKIPYNLALERFNRVLDQDSNNSFSERVKNLGNLFLSFLLLFWPIGSCALWGYREKQNYTGMGPIQSCKEAFLPIVIVPMIIAIIFSLWKHNKKPRALQILKSAAQAECDIIWREMEKPIANASTERDRKIKEARSRKETEDKQAAEVEAVAIPSVERDKNTQIKEAQTKKEREEQQATEAEAKTLTARDKKVEEARSRRDSAITYIQQEYQAFDTRLCQYLDKFQAVVGTWTAGNAHVTTILDNNRVQNLNANDERIGSYLTRIGTVNIWNLS